MISFKTVAADSNRLAAASAAKAALASIIAHNTTRSSVFISSSK
jgi:hypothetical protein